VHLKVAFELLAQFRVEWGTSEYGR
jgi:hypothetical protein